MFWVWKLLCLQSRNQVPSTPGIRFRPAVCQPHAPRVSNSESSCWHQIGQMPQCLTQLLPCHLGCRHSADAELPNLTPVPRRAIVKLARSVCFPFPGRSYILLSVKTYFCLCIIRASSFVRHSFLIWPCRASSWVVSHLLFQVHCISHSFVLSLSFVANSIFLF